MYKIKYNETELIVTEDHSIIVKRNDEYIEISPKDIIKGDKISILVFLLTGKIDLFHLEIVLLDILVNDSTVAS